MTYSSTASPGDIDLTIGHDVIRALRRAGYKRRARGIYEKGDSVVVLHFGGSWSSFRGGHILGYGPADLLELVLEVEDVDAT